MDLLSIGVTLVSKNNFRSFKVCDICQMVEKYHSEDFTQQERFGSEQQLNHFFKIFPPKNS
jgi:hypothetical protein